MLVDILTMRFVMFIPKINTFNIKSHVQKSTNNNTLVLNYQSKPDSFNLQQKFGGNAIETQVEELSKIILKRYPDGTKFKQYMNQVLEYFAQKGILVEAIPYKTSFEPQIAIKQNATSHLAYTWRDAHKYEFDDTHRLYQTPNSARIKVLEALDEHISFYKPSLFDEDAMAEEHEANFERYLPKVPQDIIDKIAHLNVLKATIKSQVQDYNSPSEELYAKLLQHIMPEEGILGREELEKIAPVVDDYKPVYAKPFDWKAHNEMMQRPFTL